MSSIGEFFVPCIFTTFLLVQPLYTLLLFREFTLLFIALPFIITVFLLAKNVHIVRIVKCELETQANDARSVLYGRVRERVRGPLWDICCISNVSL